MSSCGAQVFQVSSLALHALIKGWQDEEERQQRGSTPVSEVSVRDTTHLTDPSTKPIERSIGLKNCPNARDVTLLCTSRSAEAPKRL